MLRKIQLQLLEFRVTSNALKLADNPASLTPPFVVSAISERSRIGGAWEDNVLLLRDGKN
jgi:hypothetical protein